jgi:hypothetical protein
MKLLYKPGASYEEGEELPLPKSWEKFASAWAMPVFKRYPGFSILSHELSLPRFGLFWWRVHSEREVLLHAVADKPVLALQCLSEGNVPCLLQGYGEKLIREHQYAIFYTGAGISEGLQTNWTRNWFGFEPELRYYKSTAVK